MSSTSPKHKIRASCDRCRSHKLRCIPSSDCDPTAPCQRCLGLKVSGECTFGQRAKPGRSKRPPSPTQRAPVFSDVRLPQAGSRKAREVASLPGMNTYALPRETTLPSEKRSSKCTQSVTSQPASSDEDQILTDIWPSPNTTPPNGAVQHDSEFCLGSDTLVQDDLFTYNEIFDSEMMQDLVMSMPEFFESDTTAPQTTQEAPSLLGGLSTLLTDMADYGAEVNRLSASDVDNLPIGDAISLSKRFQVLLHEQRTAHCAPLDSYIQAGIHENGSHVSSQHLDMPTTLLLVSVHLSLLHIYSTIFSLLGVHITMIRDTHSTHHRNDSAQFHSIMDAQQYRGLSLSQLTPVCVCWAWKPMNKVVALLFELLRDIEGVIGLPAETKVTSPLQGDAEQMNTGEDGFAEFGPDSPSQDGLLLALPHSHLHKVVGEESNKLRETIAGLRQVLGDQGELL